MKDKLQRLKNHRDLREIANEIKKINEEIKKVEEKNPFDYIQEYWELRRGQLKPLLQRRLILLDYYQAIDELYGVTGRELTEEEMVSLLMLENKQKF